MRLMLRDVGRWSLRAGACSLAFALAACGKTHRPTNATGGNSTTSVGGSDVAAGGTNASGGAADTAGGDLGSLGTVPGDMRRLTAAEYEATVTDVLGTSTKPDLAEFATEVDGFDNNAAKNDVDDALYLRYLETAEAVADDVFGSDALRTLYVTCATTDDAACIQQVISAAGLRLFRRPLLDAELASYQKVYARARARQLDHDGSLKEVLIALLASAQFVYRIELVPTEPGVQPISAYDLATRLSYLLWSSAPDPKLLAAAAQDGLSTDEQLAQTVTSMLQDPKSGRFAQNFAGQWLGARGVTTLALDAQAFPEWTPALAAAAGSEIDAFFDELVRQDQDFITSSTARRISPTRRWASSTQSPCTGDTQRIEIKGADRQGFLGLAGFLVQNPVSTRSSPSARGAWILQRLLCSPVPDPPADMPAYSGAEAAIRDYLQGLGAQPACASCHAQIDPIGLALESYDALGRYRASYPIGAAIDPHVTLTASDALAGGDVSGIAGLGKALAAAPAFQACTAQKLYTYGMGREFSDSERANVQTLAEQWQRGPLTVHQLILRLVQSDVFRFRSDGGT